MKLTLQYHFKLQKRLLQPLSHQNPVKVRKTLQIALIANLALFLILTSCAYAEEINFDKLVMAIIKVESNNNPDAVSPQGCVGLMQISPYGALAEWNNCHTNTYTLAEMFDPSKNVEVGTWYLKQLYHYYKADTVEKIAAAYNGGITRLRRNGWNIEKMPKETQAYVKRIMKIYNQREQ